MNTRIRLLRKSLKLTQQEFADRIGVKRNTIATYELGRSEPSNSAVSLICREFNLNEEWLRHGTGEMFKETLEMDETAEIVSELLDENNPFYDIIKEIMRTYSKLTPNSKKVLLDFSKSLLGNLNALEKEG